MNCSCSNVSFCCSVSSCPSPVTPVISVTNYEIAGMVVGLTVAALTGSTASVAIAVTVPDGTPITEQVKLHLWFVDDADDLNSVSINPPSTPGLSEMNVITAADGTYTLSIAEAVSTKSVYLVAEVGGLIYVSSVINLVV